MKIATNSIANTSIQTRVQSHVSLAELIKNSRLQKTLLTYAIMAAVEGAPHELLAEPAVQTKQ